MRPPSHVGHGLGRSAIIMFCMKRQAGGSLNMEYSTGGRTRLRFTLNETRSFSLCGVPFCQNYPSRQLAWILGEENRAADNGTGYDNLAIRIMFPRAFPRDCGEAFGS